MTPSKKKSTGPSSSGPIVWGGGVVPLRRPLPGFKDKNLAVAFWFELRGERGVRPIILVPVEAENNMPPLVQALIAALDEQPGRSPAPNVLLVSDMKQVGDLTAAGFNRIAEIRADPEIRLLLEMMSEEVVMDIEDKEQAPDLSYFLPVPGENGVTETLANEFLAATFDFWKAKPWKRHQAVEVFRVTWPSGDANYNTVMGAAGQEFGIVVFDRPDGYEGMVRAASEIRDDPVAGPRELPAVVGFSYSAPSQFPGEIKKMLAEYFSKHYPVWTKQKQRPLVNKASAGDKGLVPAAPDFVMLGQLARAFVVVAGPPSAKKQEAAPDFFPKTCTITWLDAEMELKIEIARVAEDDDQVL